MLLYGQGSFCRAREARKKGGVVWLIDTYETPTAASADRLILIRPGSDGALIATKQKRERIAPRAVLCLPQLALFHEQPEMSGEHYEHEIADNSFCGRSLPCRALRRLGALSGALRCPRSTGRHSEMSSLRQRFDPGEKRVQANEERLER